jgi:hypothetical protein
MPLVVGFEFSFGSILILEGGAMKGHFLCFAALLLLALIPTLAIAADGCPAAVPPNPPFVPPAPYSPNATQGAFWYGTDALWTQLAGDRSVWRGLTRHDKGYFNKLFLWQPGYDVSKEPKPDIIVVLRRLDAEVPLVTSRGGTNAFVGGVWAMLTGVTFPTEGCWEITAHHDGHFLNFVVSVLP